MEEVRVTSHNHLSDAKHTHVRNVNLCFAGDTRTQLGTLSEGVLQQR